MRSWDESGKRKDYAYSNSQNPNVETRFQLMTTPHEFKMRLSSVSGTRSLMLPTKTVMTGPRN